MPIGASAVGEGWTSRHLTNGLETLRERGPVGILVARPGEASELGSDKLLDRRDVFTVHHFPPRPKLPRA